MEKLLFEIGTEEIPAKFMPDILQQLKTLAEKKMEELRIPFSSVRVYGTPRRMAFIADDVAKAQADSTVESKGPSVKIAFGPDGTPSKAAIGFARGQGIDVKDLDTRGEYVYAVKHLQGKAVIELLPAMLDDIIHSLSFPKNMRWADYDFKFVRPIRWLVALLNDKVIPVEITDVKSGNKTMGHRFLSSGAIIIPTAGDYEKVLSDNFVIVDQDKRRAIIRKQVEELGRAENGVVAIDADLLEEVLYLVEYPTALCGHFDEKYLKLPKEAVITPMRDHQRYFPVLSAEGKLLAKFITVRNGDDKHLDTVAHGNERVLRARLSDAEFFFNLDCKKSLLTHRDELKTVAFQQGLGNMLEKTIRLAALASKLQEEVNVSVNMEDLNKAAELSKADLVTGMVTEFTELQGVMGREYALLDGEKQEVAQAIYEHYLPRFAGDELPKGELGRLIGIADKIDNIVATFSRGKAPTGSQDPYALRRQALGVVNIALEAKYNFSLKKIMADGLQLLNVSIEDIKLLVPQLLEFFKQRVKNMMLDNGIRYDVIDAVLADNNNDDLLDLFTRAKALSDYVQTPAAIDSIQAFTRVDNICKQTVSEIAINQSLFQDSSEKELHELLMKLHKEAIPALMQYDYAAVLQKGNQLAAPVNKFFDAVMVMDKDENVKNNRLALLCQVKEFANMVGDLSTIVL
ncbi:Glycine--tRNA ligase beta subunit [bioreactor metagenome]|uniref:glycine--tRNA ligase n=1 Tax=bioreactor metagenome TaxID=1076179 RepID=A0A644VDK1_9ZZZZ|nr:glycine--tRNA ligase subunit beta [Acidaminococcaceae bacterium]NLU43947.1 glycine--tRNA ligase subunit beta [Acholeplasmataceae bacterium]